METKDYSVTIELGKFGQEHNAQIIPYWFTADAEIHLVSTINPKVFIEDLRKVKPQNIYQLGHAVHNRELTIDKPGLLTELFDIVLNGKPIELEPAPFKAPVSSETVDALKIKQLSDEAKALIGQSQTKIINEVGSAAVGDGILAVGIVDVDLLKYALEFENKGNKRKNVVACITQRLNAIEAVGINITAESGLEVTETVDRDLIIDGDNGTITEIPKTEE